MKHERFQGNADNLWIDDPRYYPTPILLSAHGMDFERDAQVLTKALVDVLTRAARFGKLMEVHVTVSERSA